jgi:hypothetical protein
MDILSISCFFYTDDRERKVLRITLERDPPKKPLATYFGACRSSESKWNKWVCINDAPTHRVWSGRSEAVERLLEQTWELCRSRRQEAHSAASLETPHGSLPTEIADGLPQLPRAHPIRTG